jgi:hypothetical protein
MIWAVLAAVDAAAIFQTTACIVLANHLPALDLALMIVNAMVVDVAAITWTAAQIRRR